MKTTHTYTQSGTYDIIGTGYASVPEINHMYKITQTGTNKYANKTSLFKDNELIASVETDEEMFDVFDFYTETESLPEYTSLELLDNNGNPITLDNLSIDNYNIKHIPFNLTMLIPTGNQVKFANNTMLKYKVSFIKFPLQTTEMKIQANAFEGFENLISVYIPPYVTEIGPDAFKGCNVLGPIVMPSTLRQYASNIYEDEERQNIHITYYDGATQI